MDRIPSPGVLRLIRLAAYQRAAGASWETIARAVRRTSRFCRLWPLIYRKEWSRFYNAAAAERTKAAGVEARIHLQHLMRTAKNRAIRRKAAQALARYAPAEAAPDTLQSKAPGADGEPKD